jgi:hypothetical protein
LMGVFGFCLLANILLGERQNAKSAKKLENRL